MILGPHYIDEGSVLALLHFKSKIDDSDIWQLFMRGYPVPISLTDEQAKVIRGTLEQLENLYGHPGESFKGRKAKCQSNNS